MTCIFIPTIFRPFRPTADPFDPEPGLFAETGSRGQCDVVLYSPEHTLPPSQLTVENWTKVIELWAQRTGEHIENPNIAFVAIFENCGEAVGVTMPHPHGQIYAMPFISPTVSTELDSTRRFAAENDGACLICRLKEEEVKNGSRVVADNDDFVAYVPYAARFPAEIFLTSKRHLGTLPELTSAERSNLAQIISVIRKKYDNLYGFLMPLMMAVKQAPLRGGNTPYHFHVQFLPLQRSPTKLKYLATIETAYGTFLADTAPEAMAEQMRQSAPATGGYSGS